MKLLNQLLQLNEDEEIEYHRYNVVLKTDVDGFILSLDTNVNAASKPHAIQLVRRALERSSESFLGVLKQKWSIRSVMPLRKVKNNK